MLTLSQLAFACYVYGGVSNYDESYLRFRRVTGGAPGLGNAAHRKALLKWLNKWGCRQFKAEHHHQASTEIERWYKEFANSLFAAGSELVQLSDVDLTVVGAAYESLSSRIASHKTRADSTYAVSVGPTGAAKILFAIRPHALAPWDEAIRRGLEHDKSGDGYLAFLRHVRSALERLARLCEREGFELPDLPRRLGRPQSTLPKLIDEYYWVTITRGCTPPDSQTLQHWVRWSH